MTGLVHCLVNMNLFLVLFIHTMNQKRLTIIRIYFYWKNNTLEILQWRVPNETEFLYF